MALLIAPLGESAAAACRAESGDRVVPLVELYTSEGCSSCPPADRWLSAQFPAGAANGAVALAFHVDYWDRLGWKDRFATPANTARQYQVMRANRSTFVYTPQVVVQGRDHAGWRRTTSASLVDGAAREPRARLALRANPGATVIDVEVVTELAKLPGRDTVVSVAYTDSLLTSAVKAGENRGEKLVHDHVVRAFQSHALTRAREMFTIRVDRPGEAGMHGTLVAFVQDTVSGEVLQTVSLPLAGC